MKTQFVALALAALLAVAAAHPGAPGHTHDDDEEPAANEGPSDVVVLTDDAFDEQIKEHPVVLVEFYAPWCGHCKQLAPEYEKAATLLKGVAVVAKVDATEHYKCSKANDVQGFPTLKLFVKGRPSTYEGPRTAKAIVDFVKKATEPALFTLKTQEEVDKFKADNAASVLGWFGAEAAADEKPVDGVLSLAAFKEAAEEGKLSSTTVFGVVSDASFIGAQSAPFVVAHRKLDNADVTFDAATYKDVAELLKWAKLNALLPLDEVGPHNFKAYGELGLPLVWLVLNPTEDNEAVKEGAKTLAKEFFGRILFIWLDNNKYSGQAKHIGLSGTTVPSLALLTKQGKFIYDESKPLALDDVRQWLEDVLAGKVEKNIKSAPVPEDNDQRNVFEVVGKTLDAVINDAERDVLVEFFAEYCGHCKALAPVYEELGRMMKPVPSVRIARINVPDNDINVNIRGFPTVLLFPATDKENPVVYEGDRTLASLLNFVKQHAKIPFEFPEEAAKAAAEGKTEAEEEEEHVKEEL